MIPIRKGPGRSRCSPPHWYYNLLYEAERNRGLDCEEDLAAPGVLEWNLANGEAAFVLTTKDYASAHLSADGRPLELLNTSARILLRSPRYVLFNVSAL